MIIIGLIGSFFGIGGSVMSMIGGVAGGVTSVITDNQNTSSTAAMVLNSGIATLVISVLTLVTSTVGGSAKTKTTIQTFSLANVIFGILNIYLFNYVSGGLIAVSGILGLVGSKEGQEQEKKVTKSLLFYMVMVIVLILCGISIIMRNTDRTEKPSTSSDDESISESKDIGEKKNEDASSVKSVSAKGILSSYQCGDNCWLTITIENKEKSFLCAAKECTDFDEATFKDNYSGKKVQLKISKDDVVDGSGKKQGESESVTSIEFID